MTPEQLNQILKLHTLNLWGKEGQFIANLMIQPITEPLKPDQLKELDRIFYKLFN